ncbi:MAG: DUF192 domain-containing protein [Caldilineaceae bacterium]
MVQVQNVTREHPLMLQGRVAANSWTRLRGLIGVRQLAEGEGLLIKPCHGVHCMFMSIPIDVVYVDRSDRVVAVDKAMKPWAVGKIYRQSAYVVELPVGAIDASGTQPGDQLKVDYGKTAKS